MVRLEAGLEVLCVVADSFASRLLGLAFLHEAPAHGLLFPGCSSVHTFGMWFAIDVVILHLPTARVLERRDGVPAGRLVSLSAARRGELRRRDVAALELPSSFRCRVRPRTHG